MKFLCPWNSSDVQELIARPRQWLCTELKGWSVRCMTNSLNSRSSTLNCSCTPSASSSLLLAFAPSSCFFSVLRREQRVKGVSLAMKSQIHSLRYRKMRAISFFSIKTECSGHVFHNGQVALQDIKPMGFWFIFFPKFIHDLYACLNYLSWLQSCMNPRHLFYLLVDWSIWNLIFFFFFLLWV